MFESEAVAQAVGGTFTGVDPGVVRGILPGQALQREREALGVSLAEVARVTRISERHLRSIEQADYATFPAGIYAVGFAKTYARYVGLAERWIGDAVREHYHDARGRREPDDRYPNLAAPGSTTR